MKLSLTCLCVALAAKMAATAGGDLAFHLEAFSAYRFGDAKDSLHATRLAALRGANAAEVRRENERLLIAFVESAASVDARREACLWLANLGTEASVPVLEALAGDERFADVAGIALAEVRGERPGWHGASPAPAIRVPAALIGDDEREARMAFEAIATGAANKDARAWLVANLAGLPPHRQLVAMHALLRADANEAAAAVEQLTESPDVGVRSAAVVARARDISYLTSVLFGEDETWKPAAIEAMVAAPEHAVREWISKGLRVSDVEMQAMAIDIAARRGAGFAGDGLLRIANDAANPNRKAAIAAIATATPVDMMDEVVGRWLAAAGGEVASDWQATVWAVARRQPDYPVAVRALQARVADAPESSRAAIVAMAGRLESAMPDVSFDALRE